MCLLFSFRVLSLNVRSFSTHRRNVLLPLIQDADIVLLQETHHGTAPDVRPFFARAFFSAGPAESGGVAILLSPRLQKQVARSQLLLDYDDRAIAVMLWLIDGRSVVCASLYAHSGSRTAERRRFLARVFTDLEPDLLGADFVFVGGDLNCVRSLDLDRASTRIATVGHQPTAGAEEIELFLQRSGLVDAFRHAHPALRDFTCVTDRQMGASLFHTESRIDYVFTRPFAPPATVRHRQISPPNVLLDHRAVEFVFDLPRAVTAAPAPAHPFTVWRISPRVIRLDDFARTVRGLLDFMLAQCVSSADFWHAWPDHKHRIRCVAKNVGSREAARLRAAMTAAEAAQARAADHLAAHPGDVQAVAAFVAAATDREQVAMDEAVHFAMKRRVAWVREYESSPRELRNLAASVFGAGDRHPTHLRAPDGRLLTDPAQVLALITDFYRDLYTPGATCRDARRQLLAHLPVALTAQQRDALDRPLSPDAIEAALLSYHGRVCSPGPDGLTYDVYTTATTQNARALSRVAAAAMQRGALPRRMMAAHLRLLPKSSNAAELENIRNWRPISLINTDVRVLSKALATRLQDAACALLHPSQCGFVRGRRTTDCILPMRTVMDVYAASASQRGCAIVFLDQYKAYDMVDHGYLFDTLEHFGFGADCLSLIRAIHCGGTMQVRGANGLGERFEQRRGVRQGDPSSPLLYNFALEPLLAALRATLTPVLGCVVAAYADDVAIFLDSPDDAHKMLDLLRLYERASGARLNDHKTRVLLLGAAAGDQEPWRRAIPHASFFTADDPVVYLGVQLGGSRPHEPPYERATSTLGHLEAVTRYSSPSTRVVCANTFATSRLFYAWSHLPSDRELADKLNDHLLNFVWQRKRAPMRKAIVFGLRTDGRMGLLDAGVVVRAMKMRLLGRVLVSPPSPGIRLIWAALRKTIVYRDNVPQSAVIRLKPPWLDASDDQLMSAVPQRCASVLYWQGVVTDVFELGGDIRLDAQGRPTLMMPFKYNATWRPGTRIADADMRPLHRISSRRLRMLIQRKIDREPLLMPPVPPWALHWHAAVPQPLPHQGRRITTGQHWGWIHASLRLPKWRDLHFRIVHEALAVNARLVHTVQDYDTCEVAGCTERETVKHLFFECPTVRHAWSIFDEFVTRAFARFPASAPPAAARGPGLYVLSSLVWYAKVSPAVYAALCIGQAAMLQAIWDVRNGAKFDGWPFTTELVQHCFISIVRSHLRYVARSMPWYMRDAWVCANDRGLFAEDRRTFLLHV